MHNDSLVYTSFLSYLFSSVCPDWPFASQQEGKQKIALRHQEWNESCTMIFLWRLLFILSVLISVWTSHLHLDRTATFSLFMSKVAHNHSCYIYFISKERSAYFLFGAFWCQSFTHICQGYFTCTRAIIWYPRASNAIMKEYEWLFPLNSTMTILW